MHGYEWHVSLDHEDHPETACDEPGCLNKATNGIAVRLWPPQGDDSAEDHFFCHQHEQAAEKCRAKLMIDSMSLND